MEDKDNKIGTSLTKSATLLPELYVDNKTGLAYYDLPGFKDTRGVAYQIAVTYFIKKVVDHAKSVKMIFLVDYNSLTSVGTRYEFMNLVNSAKSFVKDLHKFQNSTAIIASKIKRELGEDDKIIQDDVYIKNVGQYLKQVSDENSDNKNITKFIDALLEEDNGNYSKIGIFRLPYKKGPFSDMPLLQPGRDHAERIIKTKLVFTDKSADDFGYTISSDSQKALYGLATKLSNNIWCNVYNVSKTVEGYYSDLVEKVCNKIQSLITNTTNVDGNVSEVRESLVKISNVSETVSNLVETLKNLSNPLKLGDAINSTITSLGINVQSSIIQDISSQGSHLGFVYDISNKTSDTELTTQQWDRAFKDLVLHPASNDNRIQYHVYNVTKTIESQINSDISNTGDEIKKHFSSKEGAVYDISKLYDEVRQGYDTLLKTKKATNDLKPKECVQHLLDGTSPTNMNITTANDFLSNAIKHAVYLTFLQEEKVSGENKTHSFKCANRLEDVIKYLDHSQKWYKFLLNLYNKLSEYEIQKNTSAYDTINLVVAIDKNKKVSETSLGQFLQKVYSKQYYLKYDDIKDIKLDEFKINSLNRLLNFTLKNTVGTECSDSNNKLVIKGHYVKLSDIDKSQCSSAKSIKMYALSTAFIDNDFDRTGKQVELSIIAPTWNIPGAHKIILDGKSCKAYDKAKAQDGIGPGSKGEDGKPGLPGGHGGNFLGIGETFMNAQFLSISSNGGKGGPGQNGGDGAKGKDGEDAYNDAGGEMSIRNSKFNFTTIYLHETHSFFGVGSKKVYNIYGEPGGDGGAGGAPGNGGLPGSITMIPILNKINFNITNVNGQSGSCGSGGNGAIGGQNGKDMKYTWQDTGSDSSEIVTFNQPPSQSGKHGANCTNNKKIQDTTKPALNANLSYVVNDYKSYLIEKLIDSVIASSLMEWYNLLKNHKDSYEVNHHKHRHHHGDDVAHNRNRRDIDNFNDTLNLDDNNGLLITDNVNLFLHKVYSDQGIEDVTDHFSETNKLASSSASSSKSVINTAMHYLISYLEVVHLFNPASLHVIESLFINLQQLNNEISEMSEQSNEQCSYNEQIFVNDSVSNIFESVASIDKFNDI